MNGLGTVLCLLAAAPASESLQVVQQQSLTLDIPAATAAYSVDASIAEVTSEQGRVTIVGRQAGLTQIGIVSGMEVTLYSLEVTPPPRRAAPSAGRAADKLTVWDSRFESQNMRLTNGFLVRSRSSEQRSVRFELVNSTRMGPMEGTDGRTSFPWASVELTGSPGRLVLLDERVDHTPLTVQGASLRGVHFEGSGFKVHAGYTSPLLYQGFFLSSQAEAAIGVSYTFVKDRSAFTPTVYEFPLASSYGGTQGLLGSMMYEYGLAGDRFRLRSELAFGGKVGAAAQVSYDGEDNRLWVDGRFLPRGLPSLGLGQPHGTTLETGWSNRLIPRLTLNVTGGFARYELPTFQQRSGRASGELSLALTSHWTVSGGASYSTTASGPATQIESLSVPTTLRYDGAVFGMAATYRFAKNSASNAGGHGGRLQGRARVGGLLLSAYGDYQQSAATLDLVFREQPELERQLTELGLEARTPEELEQVLRTHSLLADLGFIEGVSLNLHPWRFRGGVDVTWKLDEAHRHQLKLHALLDRSSALEGMSQTVLANASYSVRLTRGFEAMLNVSAWTRSAGPFTASVGWSAGGGFQWRINDVPGLPSAFGSARLVGQVFRDEGGRTALEGVTLWLDGKRFAVSEDDGTFVFDDVGAGLHRVEAVLPKGGAYFTTPSSVTVAPGESVSFGIAFSPARIQGVLSNDQGSPVPGATLRLVGESKDEVVTTDQDGQYRAELPPGSYRLVVDPSSLPEGYDSFTLLPVKLQLQRDDPREVNYEALANRTVTGAVKVKDPARIRVRILELGRGAWTNTAGVFTFRNLPPGRYTLVAKVGMRRLERTVEIPDGPALLRGIDLLENHPHR
jgi:hypothetical protein